MRNQKIAPENIAYLEELIPESADSEIEEYFPENTTESQYSLLQSQSSVNRLISAFRHAGYLYADVNPLKGYLTRAMRHIQAVETGVQRHLNPETYGLTERDMEETFYGGRFLTNPTRPLKDLIETFRDIYCSTMGSEFMHIQNRSMRTWLLEKLEHKTGLWDPGEEEQIRIQKDLIRAKEFERFLGSQYLGQKRFSLEGAEALIPALNFLARSAAGKGVKEIVLGMSHRGRLNVLAHTMGKPLDELFGTFGNTPEPVHYMLSGDVKYHLGYESRISFPEGEMFLHLTSNPSHLESVNPVVEGKARGFQNRLQDKCRKKVIPVLIHGDAAFSGQGIVAETLNLAKLKGYTTGGTIHLVVNNQIGFTTAWSDSRSTLFPTSLAKGQPVPIFHVNGYDPEQVVRAMDLALRYRQKFGFDVVIDLICYRVHGHNESDEPTFTHPGMYSRIKSAEGVYAHYGKILSDRGIYPQADQDSFLAEYREYLKEADKNSGALKPQTPLKPYTHTGGTKTGLSKKRLKELGERLTDIPENLNLNRKLMKIIQGRREMVKKGTALDWATAEQLAFASLVSEGCPVRLSGEDSGRGTFSQRHAVWWNHTEEVPEPYYPLQHITPDQEFFRVYDSPLSEFAVLGFEFGYSLTRPNVLVLWEAQFGDFVNEAQVIIDQYIAASETKWQQTSGLVLLLPHGFEGQGPEHSSGYLERFLQLCAEENMQVCNCSTPAQYFHLLRRQAKADWRKPLIVMTPKSLLRDKRAVSHLDDFKDPGFKPLIHDGNSNAGTLLVCSGKIYHDLADSLQISMTQSTPCCGLNSSIPLMQRG